MRIAITRNKKGQESVVWEMSSEEHNIIFRMLITLRQAVRMFEPAELIIDMAVQEFNDESDKADELADFVERKANEYRN